MTILIIIAVVVFAGIGVVIWILINDEKNTPVPMNFSESDNLTGNDILNRVGLEEKPPFPPTEATLEQSSLKKEKKLSSLIDKIKSVIRLPKKSKAKEDLSNVKAVSTMATSVKGNILKNLLAKLPFKKTSGVSPKEEDIPEATTFLSLKDHLTQENQPAQPPPDQPEPFQTKPPAPSHGTAGITASGSEDVMQSIGTPLTQKEEATIEKEINQTNELENFKEKHNSLNKLFEEKSQALEKAEEQLQNEIKNRKDFNRIKDLIEKELKDTKDNLRNVQADLNSKESESGSNQKKINQLEEKATNLEKEIISKEEEIENLKKKNKELVESSETISINDIPPTSLPATDPETDHADSKGSSPDNVETPEDNLSSDLKSAASLEEKPAEPKVSPSENIVSDQSAPVEVGEEEKKDEPALVEEEPTGSESPSNENIILDQPAPVVEDVEVGEEEKKDEPMLIEEEPSPGSSTKDVDTSGFLDLNDASDKNSEDTNNPK